MRWEKTIKDVAVIATDNGGPNSTSRRDVAEIMNRPPISSRFSPTNSMSMQVRDRQTDSQTEGTSLEESKLDKPKVPELGGGERERG